MSDHVIENPPQIGQVKPEMKTEEPKEWVVVVYNDDTTPFDEVIDILRMHFDHNADRAHKIMVHAHFNGEAEVQRYKGQDIAETKAHQATQTARSRTNPHFGNMPLELTFAAHQL